MFDELLDPVNTGILTGRGEPEDVKLGEFVNHKIDDYEKAAYVIIGVPQNIGVQRNQGRTGAAEAPLEIRKAFYKFSVPAWLEEDKLIDLGDIKTEGDLEDIHERLYSVVLRFLKDNKRVIILGGGNDISYPDVKALAEHFTDILAVNVDSHFDVRSSGIRHSGTPYRQVLEDDLIDPNKFFQIANKEIINSSVHREYLDAKGVNVINLEQLEKKGIGYTISDILLAPAEAIFWGFDIDAVKSEAAPGVSAPYPVGLDSADICKIAQMAGEDKRTKIIEISEVNPLYDVDGRTSKLAAMMILYYLTEAVKQ